MSYHDIVGADLALGYRHHSRGLAIGADDAELANALATIQARAPSLAQALAPQAAQTAMVRELAARNASVVVAREPLDSRTLTLPFPETVIPANSAATIQVLPQTLFRCERFVIQSDIAGSLVVDDIRIGTQSQFSASGPVPARCFSEVAVGVGTLYDTAEPGITISLSLRNISGNPVTFRAAMFGRAVR